MVALTIPPAIHPIPDASKHLPGEPHQLKNGIYTNGKAAPDVKTLQVIDQEHHKALPPKNSSDAFFGPKHASGGSYEMLNQPLGASRPLKIIYLGGGASGESFYCKELQEPCSALRFCRPQFRIQGEEAPQRCHTGGVREERWAYRYL